MKPNVSHFHIFELKCFLHNNGKYNLDKFNAKSNEALFIRYPLFSNVFYVYNYKSLKIEKLICGIL